MQNTDPGAAPAAPTEAVPAIEAGALRRAQLAAVYEQGPVTLVTSAAIMLACAALLVGSVEAPALAWWLAAGLGSLALRVPITLRCRRLAAGDGPLPVVLPTALILLTGTVYGALALFHGPSQPMATQIVLILFPLAVTVGVVPSYGNWPPLFFAFAATVLLPLLAAILFGDAPGSRMLALPLLVFLAGEAAVAGRAAVQLRERIRLQLGNAALVARLTERAAELEGARDAARRASAAKSEFLARMSHELRTPLNGVLGMSRLLAGSELDAAQRRRLATLEGSGRTLLELVDQLLDMATLRADELVLEPVPTRLRDVLDRLEARFGARARAAGLDLELGLDPGVPTSARLDPARLGQVLGHLVDNALKFTERGHVAVRVASAGDATLLIVVEDTGVGMDPELARSAFEPFVQGDGTDSRRHGGTGIGLAIASDLVRLMGGTIRTSGTPGVGTRVVVELPFVAVEGDGAAAAPAAPVPAPASALASTSASGDRMGPGADPGAHRTGAGARGARVLVAEDNAVNRLVVQATLEELGCAVELVEDGERALGAIGRRRPDLVLMDCQMPVLDGYEATRRLRAGGVDVPVVALTANALDGDRERCLEAGMDDYLTKPIDRDALEAAIGRWRGARSPAARAARAA